MFPIYILNKIFDPLTNDVNNTSQAINGFAKFVIVISELFHDLHLNILKSLINKLKISSKNLSSTLGFIVVWRKLRPEFKFPAKIENGIMEN